jgi:hypothetical protein
VEGEAVVVEGRGGGNSEIKLVWKSQGGGRIGRSSDERELFFFWLPDLDVSVQQETWGGGRLAVQRTLASSCSREGERDPRTFFVPFLWCLALTTVTIRRVGLLHARPKE